MITKTEMIREIKAGALTLSPLRLEALEAGVPLREAQERSHDNLILYLWWQKRRYDFEVEVTARYTPQALEQAIGAVLQRSRYLQSHSSHPMIIMPYLSENALRQLEKQAISGIDLCGNGVVVVPDELLVFRTGFPNKYSSSALIKNVYRGSSSLVSRVFLARPEYSSVGDIEKEIKQRGSAVNQSTVSKVLNVLEGDLIVGRSSGTIRLLQPEKLLEKLAASYQPPQISRRFQAKYLDSADIVMRELVTNIGANHERCVLTGSSSVHLYATMASAEKLSLYCTNIDAMLFLRDGQNPAVIGETTRFADIELLETQDERCYFDSVQDDKKSRDLFYGKDWLSIWLYRAASPVQTYLELMAGGPREKQTAEQVKQMIIRGIEEHKP